MPQFKLFVRSLSTSLRRARRPILVVALTYLVSVVLGILMAHAGNEFALSYRDEIVGAAQTGFVIKQKDALGRALADFAGNLTGAMTDSLGGFGVVFPFPLIAYRGWVGGIVSVDGSHTSRLLDPTSAAYYLSVVVMQLSAYTLAAGAGIHAGLSLWRNRSLPAEKKWLGMSVESLQDLLKIYTLVIPIFLLASLWEFMSPWR